MQGNARLAAFDSADPFDATAEEVRTTMCDAALSVMDSAGYQKLTPENQILAVIGGMITATITVAFAFSEPAAHDDAVDFIRGYIDQARVIAEGIQLSEGSVQ